MTELKSHPDLLLSEHISQVSSAMDGLLDWHSKEVISSSIRDLSQRIVQFHDVGKATDAFQKYIRNPDGYTDDPMGKAHTPLSMLITLITARKEYWNELDAMIIAAIVCGHHKGLPTLEEMREIGSGIKPKILKRQIPTLKVHDLREHCSIQIDELDSANRPWAKAQSYLDELIFPIFNGLSISDAVAFRLKTQLLFSLLLEADKAFLAVKEPETYLFRKRIQWKPAWIDRNISRSPRIAINEIRQEIRGNVLEEINNIDEPGIYSLTSPTGSGKTLLAATWLLELRQKFGESSGVIPKAIIVLPFLSVIDQTSDVYRGILNESGEQVDGSWFLTSHSLSDRGYQLSLEEDVQYFFIDTWRTELVITTYDQFLLSLLDPHTRYQMRFHNLCDALIVMDEVQSLPCKLWKPLEEVLRGLVRIGNTSVLLMSATLPSIIPEAKPLLEYESYFEKLNRYKLHVKLHEKLEINDFCDKLMEQRDYWLSGNKRILITLNTRNSARLVRDTLANNWPAIYSHIPLFFISADVTPKDRLETIDRIKQNDPCIVVSTQCIEAGVDIDMDYIIRDFAPLDSLIQIAGRCNRSGKIIQPATVEIVDLVNPSGNRYSDMIYDEVHLQITRQLLGDTMTIEEKNILPLTMHYFKELSERKDTGSRHLDRFAGWLRDDPVHEMLRGKEREKYNFLVIEQDPGLEEAMKKANGIVDRWKRREAWRALSGRIARISVDVYAKKGFNPRSIARDLFGNYWLLCDGFYSPERGILIDEEVAPLIW